MTGPNVSPAANVRQRDRDSLRRSPGSAESELVEDIAAMHHDPLAFVLFAFPWREAGSELEKHAGPRDWQRRILTSVGEAMRAGVSADDATRAAIKQAVASGHGIGKLHPHSITIPTPHGYRRWGDLRTGDAIFAQDGTLTRITAVHPNGTMPIYRVWFDDGSYCDCGADHNWSVRGRRERRRGVDEYRTMTTAEIVAAGVHRSNGAATARQWEIPRQGPAEYPRRELPIDPYLLGLWLGDGDGQGRITCAQDAELRQYADDSGIPWKPHTDRAADLWRPRRLKAELRSLGLSGCVSETKRIPAEYLTAHIDARWELLCGLMDSDGTIGKQGAATYATTSRQLACDVMELARSLGGKASMHPSTKQGWYNDDNGHRVDCRPCHVVTVRMDRCPFRVARKADRWSPCQRRYLTRWIDRVEYVRDEDASCIEIDHPSRCYLANNYIVTHNSALVSWLLLWAMSTRENTRAVITANTEAQLRTKTWPEVAKWHRLAINSHWFKFTATSLHAAGSHEKTWRADAIPWSETNTEAFAGLHNMGGRVLLVFDEASAIADRVWEVAEGALTDADTEIIWCAFGNPTRNTGRFRECFGRLAHRWRHEQIDSRTVDGTNKAQLQQWVEDYGEDSDFVRVRVKGQFPRAGSMQFIGSDVVADAAAREEAPLLTDPVVVGVDVARFGDDESVIQIRRGRDARSTQALRFRGIDTMTLAGRVAEVATQHQAEAVFVDVTGVGGGVVDRLRQLGHQVIEVNFGGKSDNAPPDAEPCANKSAEMWAKMRTWLKTGGAIEDDADLRTQLEGREYGYNIHDQIVLERKDDMKKRGLASPDRADALALTFAYPVAPRGRDGRSRGHQVQQFARRDYDPF